MDKEEIWKDIKGYEGRYKISNLGNVLYTGNMLDGRKCEPRFIKPRVNRYGYVTVCLYTGRTGKTCMVHRLIAVAFIPNPEGKKYVDHINTIRDDNRIKNLRWCTARENINNPLSRQHLKKSAREVSERIEVKSGRSERMKLINDIVIKKRCKPVLKFNEEGVFLEEYMSMRRAAKDVGGFSCYIRKVCRGQMKSYRGYIWKYKD